MISETLLIRVLAVEGALLVGSLAVFFGHGFWLWWERKWSQPLLARAQAILATALEEPSLPSKDLDWLRTLPLRLQVRLFVEAAPSLSGVSRQRLAVLAEGMGLVTRAEDYCRSRLWWLRLWGVRLLIVLGGGKGAGLPLLRDYNPVVRAQAAEWAADHPSPDVIDSLLALLGDPQGLCRFMAQDSLLRMDGVVVEPLARYLATHSGREVEAALAIAAGLAEPRFLQPALTLCRDESPRTRALSATLLGALGGSAGVRVLMELLADSAPEVRAAAARALGKLGYWPAAPTLATLLRDRAWVVRLEAGLALRSLGAPGVLFLRRYLSDGDRFAADIAQQVLDLPDTAGLAVSP